VRIKVNNVAIQSWRKQRRKDRKMESLKTYLVKFFGVAIRGQTYLNALYLFLAFPLGLVYFIFLMVGLSSGIALTIVWVGLLILLVVFITWTAMAAFERQMAIWLLREEIPPMSRQDPAGLTLWQQFKATVTNPVTWKGLVYLLAKFPLGLLSFVVLVTLFSVSVSLLAAPFYYSWVPNEYVFTLNGVRTNPVWVVDTLGEALLVSLAGILLTVVSMHILNSLAWVSGKFARIMLGNFSAAPTIPQEPISPSAPMSSDTPALAG
jgi:hypothetical protein